MFANEFLTITIAEVLGLIVTIAGIWFVVRQLNATRLASQMEGLLSLSDKNVANASNIKLLLELTKAEDWNTLNDEDAYARVHDSEPHVMAWFGLGNLYELMGVLVKRKILGKRVANDFLGGNVSMWWRRLEKVARQERIEFKMDNLAENWEWLAHEFEKMDA